MLNLLFQEMFKLIKRKIFLSSIVFILLQNLFFAFISYIYPKHFIPKELFVSNYSSISIIVLIVIVAASNSIPMEYEFNTMKSLMSQSHSRQKILISKWLSIFLYAIILYFESIVVTLLNKKLFFNQMFSLNDHLKNSHQRLFEYWFESIFSNFITLCLLISIVFLVTSIFKKSSIAIMTGVVGYFSLSILGTLMFQIIKQWDFVKWNPINFMNYPSQIAIPDYMSIQTHLTINQLLCGNILYTVIFLTLGMYFFSKKEA